MLQFKSKSCFFVFFGVLLTSLFAYPVLIENYMFLPYEGTYGSDSYYYFKEAASAAFDGADCSASLAPLHVCLSSLWIGLVPGLKFLGIVVFSIIIYCLSSLVMFRAGDLLADDLVRSGRYYTIFDHKYLLSLLVFNPMVMWAVLRGLKESYVFLSYSLAILACCLFFRRKYISSSILLILSLLIMSNVKPGGAAFILFPAAAFVLFFNPYKKRYVLTVAGILSMVFLITNYEYLGSYVSKLQAHQDLYLKYSEVSPSLMSYIQAPARFILGPGVLRSFEQLLTQDVFVISTRSGDWLIFLGSIIWYVVLIFLLVRVLLSFSGRIQKPDPVMLLVISISFFGLFYLATYSIAYLGTGDTRHRAVLYYCLAPVIAVFVAHRKKAEFSCIYKCNADDQALERRHDI